MALTGLTTFENSCYQAMKARKDGLNLDNRPKEVDFFVLFFCREPNKE